MQWDNTQQLKELFIFKIIWLDLGMKQSEEKKSQKLYTIWFHLDEII